MAWHENIIRGECDGCGYKCFVSSKDEAKKEGWIEVERTKADGSKDMFILCSTCAKDYKKFANTQETEFNKFMKGLSNVYSTGNGKSGNRK